jgi:hypothetical protein
VTHQAKVPGPAARYFQISQDPHRDLYPVIAQQFRPGRGWTRYPIRKRVSTSWLRKMRGEGVTHVALRCGARTADFTLDELIGRRRSGGTA